MREFNIDMQICILIFSENIVKANFRHEFFKKNCRFNNDYCIASGVEFTKKKN